VLQDDAALALHNGPIHAVMRAALRRSKSDKSKETPSAVAVDDEDDGDKRVTCQGKVTKAGVGKGALKSLLTVYNNVPELKDDEYGSGDESEGESMWEMPTRISSQVVLLPRSKDLGMAKGIELL
jgi:hypothetical protein